MPQSSAQIVGKVEPEQKIPGNGKPKLAVLDLDYSGVESDLAFPLSVALRDEIFSFGEYEVLSREDLMALAKRLSLQQAAGDECADDQCLVSYGRSLGTRYMVAGVVSKLGTMYSISLRLLDTGGENPGVVNRANERCKCSQEDLFETVAVVAAKLMGKAVKSELVEATAAVAVLALPPAKVEAPNNFTEQTTGVEFVAVPGGCFKMGSLFSENGRDVDEGPLHEVCVAGFAMGKYEVTQGQWRKVMGNDPPISKRAIITRSRRSVGMMFRNLLASLTDRPEKSFVCPQRRSGSTLPDPVRPRLGTGEIILIRLASTLMEKI